MGFQGKIVNRVSGKARRILNTLCQKNHLFSIRLNESMDYKHSARMDTQYERQGMPFDTEPLKTRVG